MKKMNLTNAFVAFGLLTPTIAYAQDFKQQCGISQSDVIQNAQKTVLDRLKSPGSAKFSPDSEVKIDYDPSCMFMVSGWVDSQNSYGALLRQKFTTFNRYTNGAWAEIGYLPSNNPKKYKAILDTLDKTVLNMPSTGESLTGLTQVISRAGRRYAVGSFNNDSTFSFRLIGDTDYVEALEMTYEYKKYQSGSDASNKDVEDKWINNMTIFYSAAEQSGVGDPNDIKNKIDDLRERIFDEYRIRRTSKPITKTDLYQGVKYQLTMVRNTFNHVPSAIRLTIYR